MKNPSGNSLWTQGLLESEAWDALQRRDARFDGRVFYAVVTTGVYCRPSCPARKPLHKNVRYFGSPAEAEREGFRACKRCKPTHVTASRAGC